ncbi:MAG: hypothetical protein IH934_01985 [Nanoarchaeota archaeon]|nr:hypothetical protein [Nanoarchaeota archaeon]
MVELTDYLNLRNLLVAGSLTAEVLLGACGRGGTPAPILEDYCDGLIRDEFVQYGSSLIIRDVYDGKLTDIMEVEIPRDYSTARGNAILHFLVPKTRSEYYIDINEEVSKGGVRIIYGPERCFEPTPPPVDPNGPVASVHQQLNPHMYGGKDGRMPLKPPKTLRL